MMVYAFFRVAETFTENNVYLVDWDFFVGLRLIFSRALRFSQGIKFIPSEMSFLSGCSRFFRGERLIFFWRRFSLF